MPFAGTLTGDWGWLRTDLAAKGISVDLSYTEYQTGLLDGGVTDDSFDFGGRTDTLIHADFGKLGLWEGGGFHTHLESRFGEAAEHRFPRSGDILGPQHRVDVMTALKAMTLWSAWQHFEEKTKGSIEVGKLADLVILDQDPTAIDPENIDLIKVVQTIKEDVVVFALEAAASYDPPSEKGQLAFTRAIGMATGHRGRPGHVHGSGCLCGSLSKLSGIIAGGPVP